MAEASIPIQRPRRAIVQLIALCSAGLLVAGCGESAEDAAESMGEGQYSQMPAEVDDPDAGEKDEETGGDGHDLGVFSNTIERARYVHQDDGSLRFHYATEHKSQFGELFLPNGSIPTGQLPIVVLIHGGSWTERSDEAAMRDMAQDLVKSKVAVWNLEYRGTGQGTTKGPGGWPETYEDVAAALDYIPTLAESSPMPLDTSRVTVVGESAGGNLSAWACSRGVLPSGTPGSDPAFPTKNCMGLAGVYDFFENYKDDPKKMRKLLGGSPEDKGGRYHHASPAFNIDPEAKVIVLHGNKDRTVNAKQSRIYARQAREAGQDVFIRVIDGVNHMGWRDVEGETWLRTKKLILEQVGIKG